MKTVKSQSQTAQWRIVSLKGENRNLVKKNKINVLAGMWKSEKEVADLWYAGK